MSNSVDTGRTSRLGGLRRFAVAITILNVVGRAVLGFEQSWAQWLVALGSAYAAEILFETLIAWGQRRRPNYIGRPGQVVDFLLSAHIAGNAVSMLLYGSDRLWPFAFAAVVAISSKTIFRIPAGRGTRHFLNPSNTGISTTLLCFPWVGVAAPYMFTENLPGWADWALPLLIICTGTFLNARFTGRLPLIAGWVGGFVAQAVLRSLLFHGPLIAPLLPLTGVTFVLFTFYMVTDPATTPHAPRHQVLFGAAVAATYGALVMLHVVFGMFFALTIVCAARGLCLYVQTLLARRSQAQIQAAPQVLAVMGRTEQ